MAEQGRAKVELDRATVSFDGLEELIGDGKPTEGQWRFTLYYQPNRWQSLVSHLRQVVISAPSPDTETPPSLRFGVEATDIVTALAECRRLLARFYNLKVATLTYVSHPGTNAVVELRFDADARTVTFDSGQFQPGSLTDWLAMLQGSEFFTSSQTTEDDKMVLTLPNVDNPEAQSGVLLPIATALFSVQRRTIGQLQDPHFVSASVKGYDHLGYPVEIAVAPTDIAGRWECRITAPDRLGAVLRRRLGAHTERRAGEPFVFYVLANSIFTVLEGAKNAMPSGSGFDGKTVLTYNSPTGRYRTVTFDVTMVGDFLARRDVRVKRSTLAPDAKQGALRLALLRLKLRHAKLVASMTFDNSYSGDLKLPYGTSAASLIETCRAIAELLAK